MPVKPIPAGYHSVQPYLIFNDAATALGFYKKAFGATERMCAKKKDGRVDHAEVQIGDSVVMMADENPETKAFSPAHYSGSPICLVVYTENCDALYSQALRAGARSLQEPTDRFYGDRSAGIQDPFGYSWYINTHIKDVSKEELEKQH